MFRLLLLKQNKEQAEGCKQQEKMGISIRSLFQAGVEEGKIPIGELKKVQLLKKKQPTWFNPPPLRHAGEHSVEIEEESD